jgi:arginyl-tRNA synthetase
MNVYSHIKEIVAISLEFLAASDRLPHGLDATAATVEPPRDPAHGDLATNAAMVLAKQARMNPRELGGLLAETVAEHDDVESAEVAGPGFVNLRLSPSFWRARVAEILRTGADYGASTMGAGRAVNVEYVSANPTGPMHVGHGRGAVVGDALASLLAKAGFEVVREYYINDAGAQVETLARSLHLRYREALGEEIGAVPEGLYPGEYLVPVARLIAAEDGDKWRDAAEEVWLEPFRARAVDAMMALIREDLAALGVEHGVFTSERALAAAGAIDDVVAGLEARDLVYTGTLEPPKGKPPPDDWEARPQLLFRATQFGDDVDRPLRKSDGSWTYFASDIAYHLDKYRRGFATMVDVWGADHKGYVKRMQAAVKAVSNGEAALDVRLCNLVNLSEAGEPVKMSKRSGNFVTLRDVIDEVGRDAVRFIMLTRNNEALLDFDLKKVTEQSRDNPVFYVQYAHARICSVLRNAAEAFPGLELDDSSLANADLAILGDESELAMIKLLAGWPRAVESAAEAFEPHRVAFFLTDLAASFHGFWNRGNDDESLRFIVAGDADTTRARVALARAVALVIASGLAVMGVKPVEEMR